MPRLSHDLMILAPGGILRLNLHALQHSLLRSWIEYILAQERTVGLLKLKWPKGTPHFQQLGWRQGDHIWDGPHERVRDCARRTIDVVERGLQ